jgi:hypothetical protein
VHRGRALAAAARVVVVIGHDDGVGLAVADPADVVDVFDLFGCACFAAALADEPQRPGHVRVLVVCGTAATVKHIELAPAVTAPGGTA